MLAAPFRWCLVGGLAIDRWLGRDTREHEDLDVAVFRRDETSVRRWFGAWELWCSRPAGSGLDRLDKEERLPGDVHELWCRRFQSEPWSIEILIEESTADRWIYRRNARITRPIDDVIHDVDGVPVMVPEVVLLYKSKQPRDRDTADFEVALPVLSAEQSGWLREAVSTAHPDCPWLMRL